MKKFLKLVDQVSTWISVACFAAVAVIMTINIFARMFSGGLTWYMESAQFLNVWSVFIACVGLCAANDHLRIDAIDGILRKHGNSLKWMHLINTFINALFFAMLGVAFFLLASKSRQIIATIPMFKMSAVYWPIPFLLFFSAVMVLLRGIYDFKHFGEEDPDEKKEDSFVC